MFRVTVVKDTNIVEICGALKNIVACAAGFCDGLKMGDNTKAAIIRLGLKEMIKYGDTFYPGGDHATYFESCGVADLITTCYGGRNRKVSEVKERQSFERPEDDILFDCTSRHFFGHLRLGSNPLYAKPTAHMKLSKTVNWFDESR